MRKLIEKQQNSLVTCDNPDCNYEIPYNDEAEKYLFMYINKPCPKCDSNLLTTEDYLQYLKLMKIINFINRWFSWITIFYSKNRLNKINTISVYIHDGIKISQYENKEK